MTKEQFYTTELPKIKEYLRQEKEKAAQKLRWESLSKETKIFLSIKYFKSEVGFNQFLTQDEVEHIYRSERNERIFYGIEPPQY